MSSFLNLSTFYLISIVVVAAWHQNSTNNFKFHKKDWLFVGWVKNQPVLPHRMLTLFFFHISYRLQNITSKRKNNNEWAEITSIFQMLKYLIYCIKKNFDASINKFFSMSWPLGILWSAQHFIYHESRMSSCEKPLYSGTRLMFLFTSDGQRTSRKIAALRCCTLLL